jgi:TFIIF-interacting CTD phosphatase-like protein
MRVFDQYKTQELYYYDLDKGYLQADSAISPQYYLYIPFTEEQLKAQRIAKIKERLSQLSEDFVQSWAGAQIADIEARKREFADLHNELRGLLGKAPRIYY